jgi:hypothetical protein
MILAHIWIENPDIMCIEVVGITKVITPHGWQNTKLFLELFSLYFIFPAVYWISSGVGGDDSSGSVSQKTWRSVVCENPSDRVNVNVAKKFSSRTQRIIRVFIRVRHWSLPWAGWIHSASSRTVSWRSVLTAEAWDSPCGVCAEQDGTGTDFFRVIRFSPVNIIPPWPSILTYHNMGDEQWAVGGRSCLILSTWTITLSFNLYPALWSCVFASGFPNKIFCSFIIILSKHEYMSKSVIGHPILWYVHWNYVC